MNFKHLHYFWRVAKAGGVARASEQLHLTPQTISGQIGLLEENLGTPLFAKKGRNLELTDAGRLALGYAQDIFTLGSELEESLRSYPAGGRPVEFRVGVADAVPKSIAYRLIEPATRLPTPVRIVCREWKLDSLLAELATLHHCTEISVRCTYDADVCSDRGRATNALEGLLLKYAEERDLCA